MAHIKNLTQLKAAGGIVSREPVLREVTWKHVSEDGEDMEDTFSVWIIRPSLGSELGIYKEATEKVDRDAMAIVLSARLLLEDDKGKPKLIPYDDAYQLEPSLGMLLYNLVKEVSTPPKNSRQPTNSSVNSSSMESAVAPSKKLENV